MLWDPSAVTFSKQLLDIVNGKVAADESIRCILLPTDFCTIVDLQNALIKCIFPYIPYNTHTMSGWIVLQD
jgi:hypothetical protein